ncbi:MAG: glycosyltransferase family 2 protein [Spirochaetia bacterium]|nr:glycosyltransferase family 2 protein [Spirochaetia bacterium]
MAGRSPLVSVIIPTYNRKRLVREAAASVLAQTFRDFELIVVDDGSTDATEESLAAHGPALRCLRLEHSGMPGLVRNRGARAARGRYLAFLDSDDLWLPEKLELQMGFFQTNPLGPRLCHTREKWLRGGKEISQAGQKHRREGDIFADALVKCVIGPSTLVVEKDLFETCGGFREDLEIAEDYELWLRLGFARPVAYLDQALTVKRARVQAWGEEANLSEKYGHIEVFRIRALRDLVDTGFFSSSGEKEKLARAELARKCGIHASGCRKRGRPEEAGEYEKLKSAYSRA